MAWRRFLAGLLVVVLLAGCGGASSPSSSGGSFGPSSSGGASSSSGLRSVRFAVNGTVATAMIALDDGTGQKNLGTQALTWVHTASLRKGAKVVLGAMASGDGSIVCGISVDGVTVTQDADSGDGATVVCAWIVN